VNRVEKFRRGRAGWLAALAAALVGLWASVGLAANDTLVISDQSALRALLASTRTEDELVFGGDFERGLLTWQTGGESVVLTSAGYQSLHRPGKAVLLLRGDGACWLQQTLPLCRAGRTYLLTFDVSGAAEGDVGMWEVAVRDAGDNNLRYVWGGAEHRWETRGVLFTVPEDQPATLLFLCEDRFLLDNISVRPLPDPEPFVALMGETTDTQDTLWRESVAEMQRVIREGPAALRERAEAFTAGALPDIAKWRVLNADFTGPAWSAIPAGATAALQAYVKKRLDAHWTTLRPILQRWHPDLSEARLRVLFLNYLVHFNTRFRPGRPPADLKAQVAVTQGDCEVLARRFMGLAQLWLGEKPELATIAGWALGHAVVDGDGYLADPTHSVVWFLDVSDLNAEPTLVLRYQLYRAAIMGAAKQLLPEALEPNHKLLDGYGGIAHGAYRQDYMDFLTGLGNIDRFYTPDKVLAARPPVTMTSAQLVREARTQAGPEEALADVLTSASGASVAGSSALFGPPSDASALLDQDTGTYVAAADQTMPQWIEYDLGAPRRVEAAAIGWWSQPDRALDFTLQGRRDSRAAWTTLAQVRDNPGLVWRTYLPASEISQVRLEVTRAAGQGRMLVASFRLFAQDAGRARNVAVVSEGLTIDDSSPFFPPPNDPFAMFTGYPVTNDDYAAAQEGPLPQMVAFSLRRPAAIAAVSVHWYDGQNYATDWSLEAKVGETWAPVLQVQDGHEESGFYVLDSPVTARSFRLTVTSTAGQQRLLAKSVALYAPPPTHGGPR
jgi:hypothetical protein